MIVLTKSILHGQTDEVAGDFEHLTVRKIKGDVVRIEERKYYKEGRDKPYLLSHSDVFRYHEGKLMDAYQKLNRTDFNRTFRKFIYNRQDQLITVEISTNGSNLLSQKLILLYDDKGNVSKVEKHSGEKMSAVTYAYNSKSQLVKKSKTNESGEIYREESYSYYADGTLLAWESKNLSSQKKETKHYSYAKDGGNTITTIKTDDREGKTTTISTVNELDFEIKNKYETANSVGNHDGVYRYAVDKMLNWIRMDRTPFNHRGSYTLRQITYADGTVTGHLEPNELDEYVNWKRINTNLFYVWADGKDIRQTVSSTYLKNSSDVLGHDLASGKSFIMKNFKNDSTDTWRSVESMKTGVDVYWIANESALSIYHKGSYISNREALIVNNDVIVYIPSLHQSYLLKDYKDRKDGLLYAAETLPLSTNIFWYKTAPDNFRVIINGSIASGALPNDWINSTDILIKDVSGNPRFMLKGFKAAEVGEVHPVTSYN